ncbi:hypothetical protein, partial [Effusibacillus pohliae]|uniref:hypothetical protein n=1 Tax=Effusibacillus pohliae TaxID=232270 RepID=UPI001B7FA25A
MFTVGVSLRAVEKSISTARVKSPPAKSTRMDRKRAHESRYPQNPFCGWTLEEEDPDVDIFLRHQAAHLLLPLLLDSPQ